MSKNASVPQRDRDERETREAAITAKIDPADPHQVSERAYQLWLQRGCPIGSPDEDWFHAEEELLAPPRMK